MSRKLKIIVGPTAVGKTDYSISLAQKYDSPIISCDSRQIFQGMTIGTAVPDASQLSAVKHYFIQTIPVTQNYTAGKYELEALALIENLFEQGHDTLVMAGGSGFYVDAVCNGLDDMPDADPELRRTLTLRAENDLEGLRMELKSLDYEAYKTIDIANPQRVVRAVEVCLLSGKPFSSFKLKQPKKRSFDIEKICLYRDRDELYDRINLRVDKMIADGLIDEVSSLLPYRDTPALRTVGYKEIFDMIDGNISLDEAVRRIKVNTRHYAKRQLTWWRRDDSVEWVEL